MEAEIGPDPGMGAEVFGFTVCSPEWLSRRCAEDGFVPAQHHLVVRVEDYSNRALTQFLERWLAKVDGDDWAKIGNELAHFAHWEFEDYRPHHSEVP